MPDDAAPRHQQRERALSLLYEAELKDHSPLRVADELPVPPDPYVRTLLEGAVTTRDEADRRIAAASVGWPLDRMAVIDRIVLRMAVAELLDPDGPPLAVVIDEAVELAKEYSTDESGALRQRHPVHDRRGGPPAPALELSSDREVSPVRLTRTGGAVAERERSHTRPLGGVFVAHSQILTPADVQRALTRMSHEILERNGGVEDVVLIGLQTGGMPLATTMADTLRKIEGVGLDLGSLDVAFYRDDIGLRPVLPEAVTAIPVDLAGRVVILVDDVLFTGRTIRAALNALNDFGRARAVQLAVMVDRGHRELPDPTGLRGQEPPDAP